MAHMVAVLSIPDMESISAKEAAQGPHPRTLRIQHHLFQRMSRQGSKRYRSTSALSRLG